MWCNVHLNRLLSVKLVVWQAEKWSVHSVVGQTEEWTSLSNFGNIMGGKHSKTELWWQYYDSIGFLMIFTVSKEKQNKYVLFRSMKLFRLRNAQLSSFQVSIFVWFLRITYNSSGSNFRMAKFSLKYLFKTYHHRIALYTIKCFNSVTIIAINFCCWPKIENKIHYFVLFDVFFFIFVFYMYMVFNNYSNHNHDMVFS